MSTKERIRISLLIEKMNQLKSYSKRLGLEDKSTFYGEVVKKEEEKISC